VWSVRIEPVFKVVSITRFPPVTSAAAPIQRGWRGRESMFSRYSSGCPLVRVARRRSFEGEVLESMPHQHYPVEVHLSPLRLAFMLGERRLHRSGCTVSDPNNTPCKVRRGFAIGTIDPACAPPQQAYGYGECFRCSAIGGPWLTYSALLDLAKNLNGRDVFSSDVPVNL